MLKIPRFSSLLVKHPNGRQYWRKTEVDIDEHFVVRRLLDREEQESKLESEDVINEYIADLAFAQPMSTEKPLWEIHVLVDVRCLVLRIHHSIGDGCSLMSLIRAIGESSGDVQRVRREKSVTVSDAKWKWNKGGGLKSNLMYVWYSMVFCAEALTKGLLGKDKKPVLNTERKPYVAYRPQKLATATFDLDDVNMVKKAIPNATINDVVCGIIWGGFMKYIDAQSYSAPKEGQQIRGLLMANVRRVSGLQGLKYVITKSRNYTFAFSNVVGPSEQISIADNLVVSLKFSVSSSPMGIVMHLLSYMKKLEMQILVAEDVISDPKFLASCFTKTLQEMKGALEDNSQV